MFDSITDYLALVGIGLIFLPVLVVGGFPIALLLALGWLLLVKGVPFFLEFTKERHSGAATAKKRAKLEERWDR